MTPDSITEMARRIAKAHADSAQECLFGPRVSQTVRRVLEDALAQAALAAIQQTTERDAQIAENWNRHPTTGAPHETSANIATAIRETLKG